MAPQLQIGRHVRAVSGLAAGAFDESLVAEDVVEVPVAVDHPPDGAPERTEIVQQFVRLAKIGTRVDDEQGVAAAHDADVQIERLIPPPEAAITDLVPQHSEILASTAAAAPTTTDSEGVPR